MANTPMTHEDLNRFAGQWVSAESPMFDLLPKDEPMIVGGTRRHRDSIERRCFVCNGNVFLSPKDAPAALQTHPNITVLCPDCYFGMEPKPEKEPNARTSED